MPSPGFDTEIRHRVAKKVNNWKHLEATNCIDSGGIAFPNLR